MPPPAVQQANDRLIHYHPYLRQPRLTNLELFIQQQQRLDSAGWDSLLSDFLFPIESDECDKVVHPRLLTAVLDAETGGLQAAVEAFLATRGRTIIIMTARVAQKSYGTEKRFVCPPPTVLLKGPGWGEVRAAVGISGEGGESGAVEWTDGCGRLVAKHLHISDEKRKRVEVAVRLEGGDVVGDFLSLPVKVISKPSKKRQSVKNLELCIHHGSPIALFNRIRSQTVSTKYLGVAEDHNATCFVSRTNAWDPFAIWLVDPDIVRSPAALDASPPRGCPPVPGIAREPRRHVSALNPAPLVPVHYNQLIVLQCLATGMVSPIMRIRKVDKAGIALGDDSAGDPVSQLHKVAFELHGPPGRYLACLGDVVGIHAAAGKIPASSGWCEEVGDRCVWTLVGTDSVSYSFTGDTPGQAPLVLAVDVKKDERAVVVSGERLSSALSVWIGSVPGRTEFFNGQLVAVFSRPVDDILLLVRCDGVVYSSNRRVSV